MGSYASMRSMPSLILQNRFMSGTRLAPIVSLLILSTLSHALSAEEPIREDRVGICAHFSQNWSVDQVMPLIAKLGVGWIRDDLPWKDLEHTPGNYQIPAKT